MKGLTNRIVIVTGGSGLIGSAVAHRMLEEGCQVIVTSRSLQNAERWVNEQNTENTSALYSAQLDLADADSIKICVDSIEANPGLPNIVVANASLRDGLGKPIGTLNHDDWNKLFQVDVTGHFLLIREILNRISTEHSLSIVFLSSIYAVNGTDFQIYPEGMVGTPPQYAAVKAAILGSTRDLAARLASRNIRVNAVIAGGVRSPERQPDGRFLDNYQRKVMLGRMAQADEIASAVAFLASDEASYITGEYLHVDGGLTAW